MNPVEIPRLWPKESHCQTCYLSNGREWRISDLVGIIKELELEEFDYPLALADLSKTGISCENIYEFIQHCIHVNESSLDYPIIIGCMGEVLDGRHRIVKAILAGKSFIKAIKLPPDISSTR